MYRFKSTSTCKCRPECPFLAFNAVGFIRRLHRMTSVHGSIRMSARAKNDTPTSWNVLEMPRECPFRQTVCNCHPIVSHFCVTPYYTSSNGYGRHNLLSTVLEAKRSLTGPEGDASDLYSLVTPKQQMMMNLSSIFDYWV